MALPDTVSESSPMGRNLAKLPETCFGTLLATGELILIKAGEKGYYPTEGYQTNDLFPTFANVANLLNDRRGVTRAQRMAMEAGSMFGWDLPIADPDNHLIADLIEQVEELPGTEDIIVEMKEMRRDGAKLPQIKERFSAILDAARPDLAAVVG